MIFRSAFVAFAVCITCTLPTAIAAGPVAITAPANGATVGRTFTLTGTATPQSGVAVLIDGRSYLAPADRGSVGHPGGPGRADDQGRFAIQVDLHGQALSDGNVTEGQHTLAVQEFFYSGQPGTPGSARITVTVAPDRDDAAPQSAVSTQAEGVQVVSPTPSTPLTAVASTGTAKTAAAAGMAPVLGILGMAALGALVLLVVHRISPTGR